MYYLQDMCCLCLEKSQPLNNIFLRDQHGLTQFDKVVSSLRRLANAIELDGHLLFCDRCCDNIDMIYNFNQISLKNIDTFKSYKSILQAQDLGKVQCNIKFKLDKNYDTNSQSGSINIKNEIGSHSENNDSTDCHVIDDVVTKKELETVEEIVVKLEIKDLVDTVGDNDFDSIHNVAIKFDIEEDDMKKNYFDEDGERVMEGTEAGFNSKVQANIERADAQTISSWEETEEKIEEEDEKLLTVDDEKSGENRPNTLDQLTVRNKTGCENKKYNCNECNKMFLWKSYLDRHLRIHTESKPFTCKICKKSFCQKSTLNRHMLIHSSNKPHACDVCKKVFRDKWALYKHKLIHSGVKLYSCDECGKSFTHKHHLVKHVRIHTGENPFVCDVCKNAFTDKSSLNRHERLHTGEKPFFCDICNKSFIRKEHLNRHKQVHKH